MSNKPIIKKIALISLVSLLVFAPLVSLAQEQKPSQAEKDCGIFHLTACIQWAFESLTTLATELIGRVAAFFITLAANIIQIEISALAKITQSPLVLEGFKLSLGVANLGFVLAIIVIAYITIFRISGYETKKLLKNLILAALLVNFSFAIAGTIIDLSNVFGNYFLAGATPGNDTSKFSENLANSLNIQKLVNIVQGGSTSAGANLLAEGAQTLKSYFAFFTSVMATAIFSVFLVIAFYAVAFMMLIRYVYIVILLILMPIAWLMWIFPGYSQHWSGWWDKFIKWNLFYPAISFFLYLSIFTSQKLGMAISGADSGAGAESLEAAANLAGVFKNVVIVFVQIFVQVGIVLGGLITAEKLGLEGAAGALKMAGSAKNWIIGATGKAAGRLTGVPYLSERTGAFGTKTAAKGLANVLNRVAPRLAGGAVSALNTYSSRKNEVEEYRKKYLANLDEKQFAERQKRVSSNPVEATGMLAESVQRKKVKGLTEGVTQKEMDETLKRDEVVNAIAGFPLKKQEEMVKEFAQTDRMKKYANAAQKTGNPELVKEVLSVDPQLSKELIGKETPEFVKGMGGDKVLQLSEGALSKSQVVLNLSEGAVSTLMRGGSPAQIAKMTETIKNSVSEPLQKIATKIADTQRELKLAPKEQVEPLKVALKQSIKEQETLLAKAKPEEQRAHSRLEIIKQRVGSVANLE